MKILIKNGYIVSMVSDIKKGDILIEDDRISKIATTIDEEADKVLDATRKDCYARISKCSYTCGNVFI